MQLGKLPRSLKEDQTVSSLQYLFDEVVGALEEGTFNARENPHASWMPCLIDTQGWDEATTLMNQTLEGLMAIRQAAALRPAEASEKGKWQREAPSRQALWLAKTPHQASARLGAR